MQVIYKEVSFNENTPERLKEVLLELYKTQERVVFDYGDIKTGESWGETFDITGRIGKSTGIKPILILVHNQRSTGGGAILTNCILSIKSSAGKRLIYQNQNINGTV